MVADLNALFAATLLFVGGHFLLSSDLLRSRLNRALGETPFRGLYSLVMLAAFAALLASYANAPAVAVWQPPAGFAWIPVLVMPIAFVLAVAGVTTPGPTAVGGERLLEEAPAGSPARSILSVTRHPFLWATGLWAVAHLTVRGDAADLILMSGIAILSFGGMVHIDKRRAATLGGAWGPVALTTSLVPFAAVLEKRCRLDWAGIGWWRPALGLALYAVMLHAHAWLIGVSPLPP